MYKRQTSATCKAGNDLLKNRPSDVSRCLHSSLRLDLDQFYLELKRGIGWDHGWEATLTVCLDEAERLSTRQIADRSARERT